MTKEINYCIMENGNITHSNKCKCYKNNTFSPKNVLGNAKRIIERTKSSKLKTMTTIIIIAFMFFAINMLLCERVSATLSISNYAEKVTTPESSYGSIEIWDGNIIFKDEKVAIYTLLYNTDKCVEDCKASGTATLLKETTLFDDFDTRDENNKIVELKEIKITIDVEEVYQESIPDKYKEVCKISEMTGKEICYDVIDTYKFEDRIRIVKQKYNGEILKAGKYNWDIVGKKDAKESVDWAVEINGVSTDDIRKIWAPWTTADCKGTGGDNVYIDGDYCVHVFNSDGTFEATDTINASILAVAGGGGGGGYAGGGGGAGGYQYNTSYNIDTNSYSITIGIGGNGGTGDGATGLGTNGKNTTFADIVAIGGGGGGGYSSASSGMVGSNGGSGGGGSGAVGKTTAGGATQKSQGKNGGSGNANTGNPAGGGGGSDLIGSDGGGNNENAGNGGNGTSNSINGTAVYYAGGGGGSLGGGLGSAGLGGLGGGGLGQKLSSGSNGVNGTGGGGGGSGGNFGYIGGTGGSGIIIIRYLAGGSTPTYGVTSTFKLPADKLLTGSSSIEFGCRGDAYGSNMTNLTIYVWNNVTNALFSSYINTTALNFTEPNWTIGSFTTGTYAWNCLGCNNMTNCSWAGVNRTFETDLTNPAIAIVYPTAINYTVNVSNFNYTYSDTHADSCWYSRNAGLTNSTKTTAGTNFTNVQSDEGSNTWRLYCNDTLGNNANTQVTFGKDTIYPQVAFLTPANGTIFATHFEARHSITYNITDDNLQTCQTSANGGANTTFTCGDDISFTSIEGLNYVTIWANDTFGWANGSIVYMYVDSVAPVFTIDYPLAQGYTTNVSELNYTIIHPTGTMDSCWYSLNGGLTNKTKNCGDNVTDLTSNEGSNTWTIYGNDTAGNYGSASVTFYKDTLAPNPSFMATTDISGSFVNRNYVFARITALDTNDYTLYFNVYDSTSALVNQTSIFYSGGTIATWTRNISVSSDRLYYFNATACDIYSNCNHTETRNVTIDQTAPVINIASPAGEQGIRIVPYTVLLNYSASDANLQACWYNSTTNATVTYVTCNTAETFSVSGNGSQTVTVCANDTVGHIGCTDSTFVPTVIENGITFASPVFSGFATHIAGSFTTSSALTNAMLVYNNTYYIPTITNLGPNYILSNDVIAPLVSSDTNVSLYYVMLVNGTWMNSTAMNQTVMYLNISSDCGVGTFVFMNISNYDEELLTPVNGTVEYYVQLLNGNTEITQINGNFTGTNLVCTNSNLSGSTVTSNIQLRYYADGFRYKTYNVQNNPATSLPLSINLYFLNNTAGTRFQIYYTDFNYLTHPNAIIQIQRQYLSLNQFIPVEIPIIASDGSSTGSFNTDNIKYKLIVIDRGEVIDTFNDIFPVCQNIVLGTCNLYLRGSEVSTVVNGTDFAYTLTNSNNTLTMTFVIPSGTPRLITFSTNQNSRFLRNVSTCSSAIFASGGTISCGYNSTIGDSLVDTTVLVGNATSLYGQVLISEDMAGFYLLNNYIISFFLLLTLGLIFISSGVMIVVVSAVGVLFLGLIFLIKGSSLTTVSASLVWLIIGSIIIVYKISQKEERT